MDQSGVDMIRDRAEERKRPPVMLYRYEDRVDEDGTGFVILRMFRLLRTTGCGYWYDHNGRERWVSRTSKSGYAKDTVEKARESYLIRKHYQVSILEHRLADAKRFLAAAKNLTDEDFVVLSPGFDGD